MTIRQGHVVCIFGGAVAGSEAAYRLAERGIHSVVFDMGMLPYGKIELGLPKWHAKQRDQEETGINEKLMSPYVTYVPGTKLGVDISIEEVQSLGFSAVLLATGAWRDRPLEVPGIDEFEGRGFCYQNPFVAWFNQCQSSGYTGAQFEVVDDGAVIGGGLASLDVVKILMIETTRQALKARGVEADLFALEKKGIPRVLDSLGVAWEDLGLKGCTLYYRRRASDMPLVPMEDEVTPEREEQAKKVREKLLQNFLNKYLFKFEPCSLPVDKVVEEDRLAGLVFRKTEVVDGRVRVLEGTDFTVRTPLVISSIGSLPEPIRGLSSKGELLKVADLETGRVENYDNVFALGNAVTGRGNIRASRNHARQVCDYVMDHFLQWSAEDFEALKVSDSASLEDNLEKTVAVVEGKVVKKSDEVEAILKKIKPYQEKVGYDGDFGAWVARYSPERLESEEG